jgi:hypothetical protein
MSIAQVFDPPIPTKADAYSTRKTRTGRNKPAQLATRTKWSLDEMLEGFAEGRADLEAMQRWVECERIRAKGRFDGEKLEGLGEFSRLMLRFTLRLARLERMAFDARRGEYRGPHIEGGD